MGIIKAHLEDRPRRKTFARKMGFYYDQGTQSNLYKPSDGFYYQQEQNGFYYDGFYYDGFYYDKSQRQGFYYDKQQGFYYDEKDAAPAYKPSTGAPSFPAPPRFPAGPPPAAAPAPSAPAAEDGEYEYEYSDEYTDEE